MERRKIQHGIAIPVSGHVTLPKATGEKKTTNGYFMFPDLLEMGDGDSFIFFEEEIDLLAVYVEGVLDVLKWQGDPAFSFTARWEDKEQKILRFWIIKTNNHSYGKA